MLYWKYVTIWNKQQLNGKKNNSQKREVSPIIGQVPIIEGQWCVAFPRAHRPVFLCSWYCTRWHTFKHVISVKLLFHISRIEHLEKAIHIFGYLKSHPKKKLGFDPAHPAINKNLFQDCYWVEFYWDASEAITGNMPVRRGNGMLTHCSVDTNHVGDTDKILSQTEISLFCNKAPIILFSKRHNLVEAYTFGSEFTEGCCKWIQ